jgi:ribosomal protein S2
MELSIPLPRRKFPCLQEKIKLEKNLGCLKDMKDLPGARFIIDTKKEAIAVTEAKRLGIPVICRRRHQLRPFRYHLPHSGQR